MNEKETDWEILNFDWNINLDWETLNFDWEIDKFNPTKPTLKKGLRITEN